MKRSTVLTLNEPNIMMEKTLVILKPCTLQRGLVGEITNTKEYLAKKKDISYNEDEVQKSQIPSGLCG